ncbi:MAG: CotH kinase family protein, partial [Myxococcota bacterium]|nr:CotH kinase family protein [Myxococcota bacterium]
APEDITLATADGAAWPVSVAPVGSEPGVTGIVLVPAADEAVHTARIAEARAFVEGMPADEQIGLWVADSDGLTLHAELTARRVHVLARLDAVVAADAAPPPLDVVRDLAETLAEVGTLWFAVHRQLVTFGVEVPAHDSIIQPVRFRPVSDGAQAALDVAASRAATVLVGGCLDAEGGDPITVLIDGVACELAMPDPAEEMTAVACDPDAAAHDAWPFGESIHIDLTPEQHAVYLEYHAAWSEEDWELSLRIGGSAPMTGRAHFRGKGSLKCDRKPMTINLDGGRPRRWAPGAANDEILLISLCKDRRYYHQLLANRVWGPEQLFLLDSRLVRLFVNGVNQGIYLALEKPAETLVEERTATEGIIRRRIDYWEPEDIKLPTDAGPMEAVRDEYHELAELVGSVDPDALPAALSERMDLERYLRWMAFQTMMRNGDYVDEVYFFGSREVDGRVFWRLQAWDADDLWTDCHNGGEHDLEDPWTILYCAEGDLDQALLESDAVYSRFIAQLEALLTTDMNNAWLALELDAVRDSFFALLSDEDTCEAMIELAGEDGLPLGCDAAKADIEAHMDTFIADLAGRADDLMAKIAAYHEGVLP